MNPLLDWLEDGDLRSDGVATEVAAIVLENPGLVHELFAGLRSPTKTVRGHAADALEKVAREAPELMVDRLVELTRLAVEDDVAMVRMHLAMVFGHLAMMHEKVEVLKDTLVRMLADESVFTKSWVIVSLCIIARKYPPMQEGILQQVAAFKADESIAIRTKVRYAIQVLTNPSQPFPKGWVKSKQLEETNLFT